MPQRFRYRPTDVRARSYADARGRKLVTLQLDPKLNSCDGPGEAAWELHTFVVDHGIRHLGSGMSLVDAGDYDGDGSSEVLFWFSGYNQDGYVLFGDDLRKVAETYWTYH